jgi:hypothetical protein
MKVRAGNGVRIQHEVGCIRWLFPTGAPDGAINNDVGHVNALRGKLSGDTLSQSRRVNLLIAKATPSEVFHGQATG